MSESILLRVGAEEVNHRLDQFIALQFPAFSRSRIQNWIESGQVTVRGKFRKAKYRVKEGEEVCVIPTSLKPLKLVMEPIPLKLVYEDKALVVVDKPAGLVVHPGAGNLRGTLVNTLLYHFPQISRPGTIRPGIVHRLDKATSGLLVVAKNEQVHDSLVAQFKNRQVEKQYLALLYGRLEKWQGTIEIPLGRDPWNRTKISPRSTKKRFSRTGYRLIRVWDAFSYVEVIPETGRTHQIRVHFQCLGHPLVGDKVYAERKYRSVPDPERSAAIRRLGRHFLHASRLTFVHPETNTRVSFQSSLPPELAELLRILE